MTHRTKMVLFAAAAALLSVSSALPAPLDFFPGQFEKPREGTLLPACGDDGDFSDCTPQEREYFTGNPEEERYAGARGMLVYANGAVVPVEGTALVKARALQLSSLNRGYAFAQGQNSGSFPAVVDEVNYAGYGGK